MYDEHRGEIKYPKRYKQLISYKGLERHRKITPTDIDGLIDYAGNAFFYMECKLESKYNEEGLDYGQRRAIENLIESHKIAGHLAIAIIFVHNCDPEEIIIAKDKIVKEIYFEHEWKSPKPNWSVINAIYWFENYCKKNNICI